MSSTLTQAVKKAGWVLKEVRRTNIRTRRYLILRGTLLSHYIREDGVATWEIDINKFRLTLGQLPLQFNICLPDRTISFFAEKIEDLIAWVSVLKSANCMFENFYLTGKELGKGSYGAVFSCTDRLTGMPYAVKIIHKNHRNRKQKRFIDRERAIMTTVNHPHIVRTVDVFEDDSRLVIVSEYMKGGELFAQIVDAQYFSEQKSKHIMRQILLGVQYLHRKNIVHRDIKPENILCTSKIWPLQVKLTDFGLSNFLSEDEDENRRGVLLSHVGTSYYIAPEIIGKKGYGPAVDMWACGIVMYILLSGRFPFWGNTDIEYVRSFTRGPYMQGDCWTKISDEAKSLILNLLNLTPEDRLTAEEVLSHPWLSGSTEKIKVQVEHVKGLSGLNGLAKLATDLCGRFIGKCDAVHSKRIEGGFEKRDGEERSGRNRKCDAGFNVPPEPEHTVIDLSGQEETESGLTKIN